MTEPDCIFCRIVAGEIPCHRLYEDDRVLAFLDIGPLSEGHCLIIPNAHYATIDQMPGDLVAACTSLIPRLSKALIAVTNAPGWNVLQNNGAVAGQAVDHVHFHLIPRHGGDGLGYRWPAGKLDTDRATELVAAIQAEL